MEELSKRGIRGLETRIKVLISKIEKLRTNGNNAVADILQRKVNELIGSKDVTKKQVVKIEEIKKESKKEIFPVVEPIILVKEEAIIVDELPTIKEIVKEEEIIVDELPTIKEIEVVDEPIIIVDEPKEVKPKPKKRGRKPKKKS